MGDGAAQMDGGAQMDGATDGGAQITPSLKSVTHMRICYNDKT